MGLNRWSVLLVIASGQVFAADYAEEVESLVARDDVREALEYISEADDEAEARLIELTEIPAPPFKESNRAEYYAYLLEEAGAQGVHLDKVGNVIGRIPGESGGKTLAIVAHVDTVFPEGTDVKVRREKGRYCAPGIGDNSRGLVTMLLIAQAIDEAGITPKHDILLVGSVGEEGIGDLRGVRHLLRNGGPRVDEFIGIDGGGSARITARAVGSIRYRLKIRGPGGHSYGAFGLANPAHALARAIHYFDQKAYAFVKSDGVKATYNIGRIGGGTSVNSIPFENWAEVDMRSVDSGRLLELDAIFRRAVETAVNEQNGRRERGKRLKADPERIGLRPAGETPLDTPLVQRVMATMRYSGIEPLLREGSTDANLPMSMGIPAVTIGGGGSTTGAHSLSECWLDKNSEVAVKNALVITLASVGVVDASLLH
ncbi:MAG: M20/M25/M40 family metallo-hydrolase [Gammaproteobacteria bacterium]|nr:M20/M25/M40 family metallo-hydrolase [Gammaproteobacteria bacterium]